MRSTVAVGNSHVPSITSTWNSLATFLTKRATLRRSQTSQRMRSVFGMVWLSGGFQSLAIEAGCTEAISSKKSENFGRSFLARFCGRP